MVAHHGQAASGHCSVEQARLPSSRVFLSNPPPQCNTGLNQLMLLKTWTRRQGIVIEVSAIPRRERNRNVWPQLWSKDQCRINVNGLAKNTAACRLCLQIAFHLHPKIRAAKKLWGLYFCSHNPQGPQLTVSKELKTTIYSFTLPACDQLLQGIAPNHFC